jgi:hypothetical protein
VLGIPPSLIANYRTELVAAGRLAGLVDLRLAVAGR